MATEYRNNVSCQKTSSTNDDGITDVAIDQALRALSRNELEGRWGRARCSSATPVSPRPTTRTPPPGVKALRLENPIQSIQHGLNSRG